MYPRKRLERTELYVVVLSTLTILLVSSLIASRSSVPAWEVSVIEFVNGWPDWLELPMWAVQQLGVLLAPVIIGLVIFATTRTWQYFVPFALVLPLKLLIEKAIVKQLVERQRPFVSVGEHINVRGPAFEGLSFPSGHTTTAFAAALLLAGFLPKKWRFVPVVWAAVVGIARIYYGEHNLLDVVAGAAMGTLFASVRLQCSASSTAAERWA